MNDAMRHDLEVALRTLDAVGPRSSPQELLDAIVEAKPFLWAVLSQCPMCEGSGKAKMNVRR